MVCLPVRFIALNFGSKHDVFIGLLLHYAIWPERLAGLVSSNYVEQILSVGVLYEKYLLGIRRNVELLLQLPLPLSKPQVNCSANFEYGRICRL